MPVCPALGRHQELAALLEEFLLLFPFRERSHLRPAVAQTLQKSIPAGNGKLVREILQRMMMRRRRWHGLCDARPRARRSIHPWAERGTRPALRVRLNGDADAGGEPPDCPLERRPQRRNRSATWRSKRRHPRPWPHRAERRDLATCGGETCCDVRSSSTRRRRPARLHDARKCSSAHRACKDSDVCRHRRTLAQRGQWFSSAT
mmetsp:Transcript_41893/g.115480  ORF Transcript_41893/g.115480 Transcript_41893/m.115480 type:complete len:204 (-) Transcript_41893:8-619(-)